MKLRLVIEFRLLQGPSLQKPVPAKTDIGVLLCNKIPQAYAWGVYVVKNQIIYKGGESER